MDSDGAIRACQIENMRSLINQARAACSSGPIAPYPFSDEPIIPGQTAISIRHINEMKTAISEISSLCSPPRIALTFNNVVAGDIISVGDYVDVYNKFVSTSFCGDGICQASEEDITTCAVDCGAAAQFYCNNIGGCYASVTCPAGRTCYPVLQSCLDAAPTDCKPCVPVCTGGKYQIYLSNMALMGVVDCV